MARLRRDADRIARQFNLAYREIIPERANVRRRYGVCYADGRIQVRLNHARTGEALKYSSLVNTLCHEMAHLRHFNHGPRFKAFYFKVLDYARREGIYRPGRTLSREWIQMDLFGGGTIRGEGIARLPGTGATESVSPPVTRADEKG
jgi:hypothetical protein